MAQSEVQKSLALLQRDLVVGMLPVQNRHMNQLHLNLVTHPAEHTSHGVQLLKDKRQSHSCRLSAARIPVTRSALAELSPYDAIHLLCKFQSILRVKGYLLD